jgi:acetolactate synthase-1/2/3 large subunit
VARAFQVATSGRRGPVVLALPEDMLAREADVHDAKHYVPSVSHPGRENMERFHQLLAGALRPLVVLGGTGWTRESCNDIQRFAQLNQLPVGCAFRFQDLFDNRLDNYVGDVGIGINPVLAERVKMADLLVVVGARLGEMTTSGYTLLESPVPRQKLVHVHPGAEEIGRVYQPELGILSDMAPFARAAAAMDPLADPAWKGSVAEARQDYLAWSSRRETPGKVQMWDVVDHLNRTMPEDTIYTNGAGNFSQWLHRFHQYTGLRTQVAPTSGAMGYGVPAAIAAKIARPERPVVCFSGDGDFLMCAQELATAAQYNAPVIILVINNGIYGTIRMHQEKHYPGRVIGTDIVNPEFAVFARAFGCMGEIVTETSQFAPALARAMASTKPAVIEIRTDPQAITPNTTLDKIRAAAQKKQTLLK